MKAVLSIGAAALIVEAAFQDRVPTLSTVGTFIGRSKREDVFAVAGTQRFSAGVRRSTNSRTSSIAAMSSRDRSSGGRARDRPEGRHDDAGIRIADDRARAGARQRAVAGPPDRFLMLGLEHLLAPLGTVMIYSASAVVRAFSQHGNGTRYLLQHLASVFIGLVLFAIVLRASLRVVEMSCVSSSPL